MREQLGEWLAAAAAYEEAVTRDGSHPTWNRRLAQARVRVIRAAFTEHVPRAPALESFPHVPAAGLVAPLQEGAVTGWIPAADGADPTVLIRLNGAVITDTRATVPVTLPDGREYLQFRRALRDLWQYAGAGDVLEFEHAGRSLATAAGDHRYVLSDLTSHADELLAKLADGHVFNKYGRVRRAITGDSGWQSAMFELYAELRRELSEELGLELFPFYGTMLGAVRDQDFISHDNDFDTVYISRHSHPDAVRAEFRDLCNFLIDRSYSLRVKKSHTWVRVPGTPHKLDIFFAWFDPDGLFQVSYGHHGAAVPRSDDFFRFRTERLGSQQIPVPANAEEILGQLYGTGWRKPDPGFTHGSSTRVLRREYHLGTSEVNEAYWRQFYREHRIVGGSSFAEFVAGRLPAGRTVLEFGCGTGRDSIFLAKLSHTVAAADLSPEAIARAEEARREAGVENARFEVLDVSSREAVARFLAACGLGGADATQVAVYLRFFLHSIDESIEDALLGNLVDLLPGGFTLYAEFRTTRDRELPKVYGEHSRRYIDEKAFAAKLTGTWGFDVDHLEAGRGLAPYRDEDPHLARIIARAPARGAGQASSKPG
jgi:SAM-dependent methyltransferase